jgi:hypothetical protein
MAKDKLSRCFDSALVLQAELARRSVRQIRKSLVKLKHYRRGLSKWIPSGAFDLALIYNRPDLYINELMFSGFDYFDQRRAHHGWKPSCLACP